MAFFTKDYLEFFKELAANNNRDWFNGNKKRYESSVKDPFNTFITEIIARMSAVDNRFDIETKKAVFRIYRDIRFSKDKSPYKMHMSAVISPGGRKEGMGIPGLYVQLGAEDLRIYSGLYSPDKQVLHQVRDYILKNSTQLNKLVNDKEFVKKFGELRGEKNKILPKEFKEYGEKEPFLYNKQFYFFASLPSETILQENLADVIMDHFQTSEPLRKFLTRARGL
ncbi:MAG: DUF2461 domain-containing protein [Flavobacteriales bacterium]|nr:DUF2461 domain-containing protein [Flavobacteriales bacterium]